MEINEIEKLLERYWNCETSIEEENTIRNFFSHNSSVSNDLERSKAFCIWQNSQASIKMNSSDEQLTKIILKDNKGNSKLIYFYPLLKVAASILIVLSTGVGIYTHYTEEKRIEQTYSETYSDPEVAMKEAQAALSKVSISLTRGQDILKESLPDADTTKILNSNTE